MEERKSKEDIEKMIKSLEEIIKFITPEEVILEEMIKLSEEIVKSIEETMEFIKEQNAKWVDIHRDTKNSYCKLVIKNTIDKNFISLKKLEEEKKEAIKNMETYKKML